MKNYYEEIAYWYFRFNGFFLLNGYVTHPKEHAATYFADNDLIGIKPPYAEEYVGLAGLEDFCPSLIGIIPELSKKRKFIGLICEVKGGENAATEINPQKLHGCLNRLGLLDDDGFNHAYETLQNADKFIDHDHVEIYKILASYTPANINTWREIDIATMTSFILERIGKYPEKVQAWNHYGSTVLQSLLHESRKPA